MKKFRVLKQKYFNFGLAWVSATLNPQTLTFGYAQPANFGCKRSRDIYYNFCIAATLQSILLHHTDEQTTQTSQPVLKVANGNSDRRQVPRQSSLAVL